MNLKRFTAALLAVALAVPSCVNVNEELGSDNLDKEYLIDIYSVDIPLTETRLQMADSISGYSTSRLTVGAVRDDVFGETVRGSAFTLVPALDTIDFGKDPVVRRFHIAFAQDTISAPTESDRYILQNVDVYALTKPMNPAKSGTNDPLSFDESKRISSGIPVYAGSDSLSFDFTKEFAMRYIEGIRRVARDGKILITREGAQPGDTVSMEDYTAELPGVYVRIKPGAGNGGRINMFKLSSMTLVTDQSRTYYDRNNNIAVLRINSEYDGVRKDTAFLFYPGQSAFVDEVEAVVNSTKFTQYAFNYTGQSTRDREGVATGDLLVEGGGGLKPVIQASELREKVLQDILTRDGNPDKAIINLATIYLPFEEPADYRDLDLYPTTLSPTCQTLTKSEDGTVRSTFNGLPDAAADVEDQGGINRSLLQYQPDITWHLSKILQLDESELAADPDLLHNYDIWLFTIHDEIVESSATSSYDQDYLQQMLLYQYLNNIYGGYGGYGGYGYGGYGYGGYGYGYDSYGYSNYMNMYLLSSMFASSGTTSTTTQTLDKDRYYKGILNGPAAARHPHLKVTYSLPKE